MPETEIAGVTDLGFEGPKLKKVAKGTPKTKLVYDPDAARKAGLEITEELMVREVGVDKAGKTKSLYPGEKIVMAREGVLDRGRVATEGEEILLATGKDSLVEPLLKPDSFNKIVAVAAELKKKRPDAFDNTDTIIDNLFNLTAKEELLPSFELQDILIKYGLSYQDYILAIIGTGSRAGQVLQKLGQIRRTRPGSEVDMLSRKAIEETNGKIRNLVMRVENIRRGGMVSQIATAARNLTSAGIRMPLEALQNVAETAMYNFQHGGFRKGLGTFKSSDEWRGAFKPMYHAFRNPREAK